MTVIEYRSGKGPLEVGPSTPALWKHLCGYQILGKSWLSTMLPPLPFLDTSKAVSLEHDMSRVHLESSRTNCGGAANRLRKRSRGQADAAPRPLRSVRNLFTKAGTSIKATGTASLSPLFPSPSYQPDSQGQSLRTGEFYPLKPGLWLP